jgi:hypothetical protein
LTNLKKEKRHFWGVFHCQNRFLFPIYPFHRYTPPVCRGKEPVTIGKVMGSYGFQNRYIGGYNEIN